MTRAHDDAAEALAAALQGEGKPRRLKVSDIMGSEREAILVHGGQEYRLRITANGKLILTK